MWYHLVWYMATNIASKNIGNFLHDYRAPHSIRPQFWYSSPWEPQIFKPLRTSNLFLHFLLCWKILRLCRLQCVSAYWVVTKIWVTTLFRVGGETISLVWLLVTDSTLMSFLGAVFVNIMTCDNVAMSTWLSCHKSDPHHSLPGLPTYEQ